MSLQQKRNVTSQKKTKLVKLRDWMAYSEREG